MNYEKFLIEYEKLLNETYKTKETQGEKFILTERQLFEFSIKLIKLMREVYNDNR